ALLDHTVINCHVEEAALTGDALAEHDVELGLPEGRGHLVLGHLDPHPVAHCIGAVLDGLDATDVETDGGVELERTATRCGLRAAEHDPDLLTELVDEDGGGARLVQVAGELAQRLGHEPGLETDMGVAHLAFEDRKSTRLNSSHVKISYA